MEEKVQVKQQNTSSSKIDTELANIMPDPRSTRSCNTRFSLALDVYWNAKEIVTRLVDEREEFNTSVLHDIYAELRKLNENYHFLLQAVEGKEPATREDDTQEGTNPSHPIPLDDIED